jgi:hypothetical protein
MALPRQRRTADLTQLIAEHLHRAARLMRELPADWRDDPALPLGSPQQIVRELAVLIRLLSARRRA